MVISSDVIAASARVFVHPSAICECEQIGEGTRVWAFAHVMDGAIVGSHVQIGDHAFVEHGARIGNRVTIKNGAMIWDGVTLEDDVFVGPGVIFTNDRYPRSPRMPGRAQRYRERENWLTPTLVRRGASIGAGAVIVCGVTIGAFAVVGASALVTRDVPDYRLVVGHPAREAGWACSCGRPLPESLICAECGCAYRHAGQSIAPNR